ncbi:dimethylsulfonioproprionate lyase family protein [Nitratireductor sp. XY-223]|uniref:dimethylsulfonioproprionate lyase family protein n=1 Tax=Nitratireductor sp. XY-223 TaxID=2561926 RepID=UPI0010AACF5C|nr:dimethylsulfonioproprionate lyase family protein [Nitratireductor sp. XY-223]
MRDYSSFGQLLAHLARLYEGEGRAGGDQAAAALNAAVSNLPKNLPEPYNYLPGMAERALERDPHPDAPIVAAALPLIRWFHVSDSLGSIGAEMGGRMMVCELLGPNGMIFNDRVRVGLFVQCPHLDYVTRSHSAEETYIILGGEAFWSSGGAEPELKTAGDIVFHPSGIPHYSVTREQPTIAAWRWSGDISYEAYACTG